ncbi:Cyclodeaminase/cyclohydrolase family protein [Candidatus Magnetomoraceae bacterium gMMP-15]
MKFEQQSVHNFINELASGNASPGGGSVSALCGALGAALSVMVSRLTMKKDNFENVKDIMEEIEKTGKDLIQKFLILVQEDADAYKEVMDAFQLSEDTEENKNLREAAIQSAMKKASKAPIEIINASKKLIDLVQTLVEDGNPNAMPDAGAALQIAKTAAITASYNLLVNLPEISDEIFVARCKKQLKSTMKEINTLFNEIDNDLNVLMN